GWIQFRSLLKIRGRLVDFSGVSVNDAEVVVISSLIRFKFDGFFVGFSSIVILPSLRIGISEIRIDHMLRWILFGGFFEQPDRLVLILSSYCSACSFEGGLRCFRLGFFFRNL